MPCAIVCHGRSERRLYPEEVKLKTLIIVIIILLSILTTPLSLKRVLDRNRAREEEARRRAAAQESSTADVTVAQENGADDKADTLED